MARLKFGPWGGIIGRLGNHIGYIRKGAAVLRMVPSRSRKKRSVGQKTTTQRFGLIIKFVAKVNGFTNVGFNIAAQGTTKTAQNMAVSYNSKHAIKGVYPDQEIDYTKIMLSQGKLALPQDIQVTAGTAGDEIVLTYSWSVGANQGSGSPRDRVMMLAYAPEAKEAFFDENGARRSEGQDSLTIIRNMGTGSHPLTITYVETYIAFVSIDGKSVSDSLYTGRVDLSS